MINLGLFAETGLTISLLLSITFTAVRAVFRALPYTGGTQPTLCVNPPSTFVQSPLSENYPCPTHFRSVRSCRRCSAAAFPSLKRSGLIGERVLAFDTPPSFHALPADTDRRASTSLPKQVNLQHMYVDQRGARKRLQVSTHGREENHFL